VVGVDFLEEEEEVVVVAFQVVRQLANLHF
jgi:hypothetical protein